MNPEAENSLPAAVYHYNNSVAEHFLQELYKKHSIADIVFLVAGAKHLQAALQRTGLRFQSERCGNRNSIEHIFIEMKYSTFLFSNNFSHVDSETLKTCDKVSLGDTILQTNHYPNHPPHFFIPNKPTGYPHLNEGLSELL